MARRKKVRKGTKGALYPFVNERCKCFSKLQYIVRVYIVPKAASVVGLQERKSRCNFLNIGSYP
ncbi:uncharacterized protein LOC119650398 isoform X2 [Hermetia illucens]|uniref:uncharacterized protein LOC119650398 isoform X2 n=1 Tax=Hermetia illucens TaxID=343691 RepID=UPI0018CC6104|nr:uncharacterized protein LOC119650398 isoform X2 [Hermetia illucens]